MRRFGSVLCVALMASSAAAQTGDASIHACVASGSGRLRVIETGGACKRRERALTWAIAGPTGTPGTPGVPGEQGPQGQAGQPGTGSPDCHVTGRLTLPGIMGEGAGGSIDVLAFQLAVEPNTDPAGGPPTISDLVVTKALDKASPQLFQAAVLGTPFASAELEVFGAGGVVSNRYSFTNVLVAAVIIGPFPRCTAELPVEDVSLAFGAVTVSPGP
jgi:type VI protein secretion system component Hcp